MSTTTSAHWAASSGRRATSVTSVEKVAVARVDVICASVSMENVIPDFSAAFAPRANTSRGPVTYAAEPGGSLVGVWCIRRRNARRQESDRAVERSIEFRNDSRGAVHGAGRNLRELGLFPFGGAHQSTGHRRDASRRAPYRAHHLPRRRSRGRSSAHAKDR